ncbi:hypothetical protein Zmor_005636 [Zophobas morio]|uniref:Ionotropic receptor n=1 Tax=Zophobas morio TaxID=2755281 RepID=A0AA38IQD9_9CUCU|nr:hypothetical protein Zmor_005636 [Zophobas morio]
MLQPDVRIAAERMAVTRLFAITLTIVPCLGNVLLPQEQVDELEKCIHGIVEEYFGGRNVAYFFENEKNRFVPKFDRVLIDTRMKTSLKLPFKNLVFFVDDENGVVANFDYLKKNDLWDASSSPRQKYLVVAKNGTNLTKISEVFLVHDILNFVVAIKDGHDLNIYQWKGHFCSLGSKITYLGTCGAKFAKIGNNIFSGCRLKTLILHKDNMFPFVRDIKSQKPGLFVDILNVVAQNSNFTMSHLMATKNETSNFLENGETVSYERLLTQRKVDVFAAVHTLDFQKFLTKMDFSILFYDTENFWVVPKSEQSSLNMVLQLLSVRVEVALAAVVLVSYLTCYLADKSLGGKPVQMLWFWGTLIENTRRIAFKSKSATIIVSAFMYLSLVLAVFYKAKLSCQLTRLWYDEGIDTMEELLASDFVLYAKKSTKELLKTTMDYDPVARALYEKIHHSPPKLFYDSLLKTLIKYRNLSTTIDNNMWKILERKAGDYLNVVKLPNYLSPRKSVFVMRKGHPLRETMNRVLHRLKEAGLLNKFIGSLYDPSILVDVGVEDQVQEVVPLNLDDLEGIFYIYLIMMGISSVVFVVEVVLGRLKPIKKPKFVFMQ